MHVCIYVCMKGRGQHNQPIDQPASPIDSPPTVSTVHRPKAATDMGSSAATPPATGMPNHRYLLYKNK